MRREPRQDGLLLLLRLLALDGELGLELGAILGGLRVRQLEVGPVLEGAFVQARLERRRLRLALGYFLAQARDLRVARLDVPLKHVDAPLQLLGDAGVQFQALSRLIRVGVGVVSRAPRRLGVIRQRRVSRFELRRLSQLRLQRLLVSRFRVQRLLQSLRLLFHHGRALRVFHALVLVVFKQTRHLDVVRRAQRLQVAHGLRVPLGLLLDLRLVRVQLRARGGLDFFHELLSERVQLARLHDLRPGLLELCVFQLQIPSPRLHLLLVKALHVVLLVRQVVVLGREAVVRGLDFRVVRLELRDESGEQTEVSPGRSKVGPGGEARNAARKRTSSKFPCKIEFSWRRFVSSSARPRTSWITATSPPAAACSPARDIACALVSNPGTTCVVRSDDGRAPTNEKVTFVGNGTKSQRLFVRERHASGRALNFFLGEMHSHRRRTSLLVSPRRQTFFL